MVFSFLLLASPQLCEIVLDMTSRIITLLKLPDAVNMHLVDASILGNLLAGWMVVIICNFHHHVEGTEAAAVRYVGHPQRPGWF